MTEEERLQKNEERICEEKQKQENEIDQNYFVVRIAPDTRLLFEPLKESDIQYCESDFGGVHEEWTQYVGIDENGMVHIANSLNLGGKYAVFLENERVCSGCFRTIPNELIENDIHYCWHCGRRFNHANDKKPPMVVHDDALNVL